MEFDKTPRFWYPHVALDTWTDFAFCSDKNLWSGFRRSYRETKKYFFPLSLSLSFRSHSTVFRSKKWPYSFPFLFFYFFFLFLIFFFYFLVLSFPLFPPLDTWINVSHSHKCTTCHAMCHPTPYALKNVKFRLSQNPTKFDEVTRFHEMNSTVKSISSSEIQKISGSQPKLPFYHFSEKLNFFRVLHSSPLNIISSPKFTYTSKHKHMHMK